MFEFENEFSCKYLINFVEKLTHKLGLTSLPDKETGYSVPKPDNFSVKNNRILILE